jgi:subtilase family serine protease
VESGYNFTLDLNNTTLNGAGQTIVLIDACTDPKLATDLATFDATMRLPSATLKVIDAAKGPICHSSGWDLESAVDVEWSHAMAPGAKLTVVDSPTATATGLTNALNYAVSPKLGNQISSSWGIYTACTGSIAATVANATADRITLVTSSGDSGAYGSGTANPSQAPADCPGVLSVGGTVLTVGAGGAYGSESAWSHAGGGYAPAQAEPSYQTKAKIPDGYAELGVPDVSAVASQLWAYDAKTLGWAKGSGTSFSSPIWAGLLADANGLRASNAFHPMGPINAFLFSDLYGANGSKASYVTDFHDVASGSNGYSATTGWDPVTGIGSMNAYPLILKLGSDRTA